MVESFSIGMKMYRDSKDCSDKRPQTKLIQWACINRIIVCPPMISAKHVVMMNCWTINLGNDLKPAYYPFCQPNTVDVSSYSVVPTNRIKPSRVLQRFCDVKIFFA